MQLCPMSWPLLLVINTPFRHLSTFAAPFGPCCSPPDLALKFSLTVNLKRKLPNICCDHCLSQWPISLLIIALCSPICQSVCTHWVCLISFYSINSLEQRFLVGFTAGFPKHKNNSNSKESERRPAQHVSPVNRRVIVSVAPFITKTQLTETAHCPTADLYFLYHSMKLLWRFVWWTEFIKHHHSDYLPAQKPAAVILTLVYPEGSKEQRGDLEPAPPLCSASQFSPFVSVLHWWGTETVLSHIWNTSIKDGEKHQYNQFYFHILINLFSFSSHLFALLMKLIYLYLYL